MAFINSVCNKSNILVTPTSPSQAFAKQTGLPIKAHLAPKAKHFIISVPLLIPPKFFKINN
jgi:hypothetical protein